MRSVMSKRSRWRLSVRFFWWRFSFFAPYIVKLLIANVKNAAAGSASIDFITMLAVSLLAIYVARGFFRFLSSYMSHVAGWGVVADVRKDIYALALSRSAVRELPVPSLR